MNMQSPIPLRPDPAVLARNALRSVARAALLVAKSAGKATPERNKWKDSDAAIDWLVRSPTAPTRISDAQALAQVKLFFLPSLVPQSAAAQILSQSLGFSFDGRAQISVPSLSLPLAGFVGESQAIPVLQGTSIANTPLTPAKLAAILTLTREMIEGADAENIMQRVLLEGVGKSLDAVFFNSNPAVPATAPAGILAGAIAVNPAGRVGTAFDACVADLANLMQALGPVAGNSAPVVICAPAQASVIASTIINPPPVAISAALPAGTIIGIVPAAIACAVGAPQVEASRETTVHMASPASDIVAGSPGAVAAPTKSMFQTDSSALRFTMDLSWTTRGPGVAQITGANWP